MTTTIRIKDNEVVVGLAGRLDTSTSADASAQIDAELSNLSLQLAESGLTCDASQLEYISSSGLRILLALSKRYQNFRVVEAQPQVYDVLETTGFTKIMSVERAMRRLSVDGCRLIGIGGVGRCTDWTATL